MLKNISLAWFVEFLILNQSDSSAETHQVPLTITEEIVLKTMVSYFIGSHLFFFPKVFLKNVRRGLNSNWTNLVRDRSLPRNF